MADNSKNLRIYNTLTRKQEPFVPIDPAHVRMYVCGPTVYDYAHIGNARPVIVFDVLFRLLRHLYGEDHVTYVRNITDVDDKINARARDTYPDLSLNEAIRKVTEATARQFHEDVAALGCLTGELVNKPGQPKRFIEPLATETIPEMIAIIQKLLDNGNAYVAQGEDGREALFDVLSMPEYGELSKRNLEEQQSGARVAVEPHKRNPADFVLWKESSPAEPGWDANFVISDVNRAELRLNANFVTIRGRPGWHIECSAMSDKWLWEAVKGELSPEGRAHPHEFDIHGGGIDLTFPHHENEIAQSRCAHGTPVMARYWMHNGFLQVEGQKMSKSLGNFVTINELLHTEKFGGRRWPGEVLRLAMLMTHYREPIDFSVRRLEEAQQVFKSFAEIVREYVSDPELDDTFVTFINDDMNTPSAITRLHELNASARKGDVDAGRKLLGSLRLMGLFQQRFQLKMSLTYSRPLEEYSADELLQENPRLAGDLELVTLAHQLERRHGMVVARLVSELRSAAKGVTLSDYRQLVDKGFSISNYLQPRDRRLAFIREKNWAEADRIRDELAAQGIQLKDGKDPQTGGRVTTWEVKR